MRCEDCNRDCPLLWRIARWQDAGHTKDLCPVCGMRLLGFDDTAAAHDERRFRITQEVREEKHAPA